MIQPEQTLTPQQRLILLKICKLQRAVRNMLAFKNMRRLCAARVHFRKVKEELVTTQQNYNKSLNKILKQVKNPITSNKLLTEREEQDIFLNLQEIVVASDNFLLFVKNKNTLSEFSEAVTAAFQVIFGPYKRYCYGYEKSIATLQKLRVENQFLRAFLRSVEKTDRLNNLDLEAFLIKPVQRIAKYMLLLAQMKKKFPQRSAGKTLLAKCFKMYEDMNSQFNRDLDRCTRNFRLSELDQKFKNSKLASEGRQYIYDWRGRLLTGGKGMQVTLYLFSDIILITKDGLFQQKQIARHAIGPNGFIRQLTDRFLRHGVFIQCANTSLTVLLQNELERSRVLSAVRVVLPHEQQLEHTVRVTVVGVEQRQALLFSKYTAYILDLRLGSKQHRMVTRFREVLQFQKLAVQRFPDLKLRKLKKHFVTAHTTKAIQQRKVLIQEIISSILNNQAFIRQPLQLLGRIGLPPTFYSALQSKGSSTSMEKEYAVEVKVGYKQKVTVIVTKLSRVAQVEEKVAGLLKVKDWSGFRLCLDDGGRKYALISEEPLSKHHFFQKSFMLQLLQRRRSLIFARYHYLSAEAERTLWKDPFRRKLQAYSVGLQLQQGRYELSVVEWCRFLGLFTMLQNYQLPQINLGLLPMKVLSQRKDVAWMEDANTFINSHYSIAKQQIPDMIIESLSPRKLFGAQDFSLKLSKSGCAKMLLKEPQLVMWVGPKGITLQGQSDSRDISYQDLSGVETQPGVLVLELKEFSINLLSSSPLEIAWLINHYRGIAS